MKILVTGGAGFIGSSLAAHLLAEGHLVTIVDDLSTGIRANLPSGAEFIEADVGRPETLGRLPMVDVVCHLAAQSSGPVSADMPYQDLQANAASTLLLSRWCVQHGVRRFVYASSMAIYGQPTQACVTEASPCEPRSYYGVSKLTSEHLLRLARVEGLQSTALRMFSIYGPGQNLENLKQGMVSIYLAYLLQGQEVLVTGSLSRFRDFVYIDDVVDVWRRVLSMETTPSAAYNIGSGRPTTVATLLANLKAALDLPPDFPVRAQADAASDQFGIYADARRAEAELGWRAQVPLDEGLKRMVAWACKRSAVRNG